MSITVAVLVLFAVAPASAQSAADPYSLNNLVALHIIPRPTTAEEARIINQIIAEQIAQTRQFAGGAPSSIPSRYTNAAQQQMTLFSIKWAYRERTDPGFYQSAEYIHDKQLLTQGCFPTCPPDDGDSKAGAGGGNSRAVLDQLRAMQAADLSGVMSPRRIEAAAATQEGVQLKYEIPKEIDFTRPAASPDESGLPAIDQNAPDIFPRWSEVSDSDFSGKSQALPCLTEGSCEAQAQGTSAADPGSPQPADTKTDRVPDSTADSSSNAESDPELESAQRNVFNTIKDYYHSLQTAVIDGARTAKEVAVDLKQAVVSDFRFGKADVNPKYFGSLREMIANEGEGESRIPLKAMVGQFLVDFITTRARNAIRQEAIPDNDPSALVDFTIRTQIAPNGSLTQFRGSEVVEGLNKVGEAAVLGVEKDDGR